MKSKPLIFTIAGVLILSACIFFFVKGKSIKKPEDAEVTTFLSAFSNKLTEGKADSLVSFFDLVQVNLKDVKTFINVLLGKENFSGMQETLFKTDLIFDESVIKTIKPEQLEVTIPAYFRYGKNELRKSSVIFFIKKISQGQFIITKIDTKFFIADHIAYENLIRSQTLTDEDIYSPVTLAAFKKVNELYAKYDTVVWFGHFKNKTFFYVVNGDWDEWRTSPDSIKKYKMGLVSPDMKEIIPVQYDLVHNVSGTFNNLIEVDRDSKHGFYNLQGEIIIPVEYDQVFPLKRDDTIAVLRKGSDYYWLTPDNKVSEKADIKIDLILSRVKKFDGFKLDSSSIKPDNIVEVNSRDNHASVYIAPSHLVDLGMIAGITYFTNPLRKNIYYDMASNKYNVITKKTPAETDGFFTVIYQSIRDHFLGGRAEFYDTENIVVVDRKKNLVYSHAVPSSYEDGLGKSGCINNGVKMINDTLFEVKANQWVEIELPGDTSDFLNNATVYHYLAVKNNRLFDISKERRFSFTSFVKMDDTYLQGCFRYYEDEKSGDNITVLKKKYYKYIINEIYAAHNYKFESKKWREIFEQSGMDYKPEYDNVDDRLTEIERYNINWLSQKFKNGKAKANNLASVK